jgi:hypothetical protein
MFSFFKSNAQDQFFGNHKKPELLIQLEQAQNNGESWEYLGFYIDYDIHYTTTPLDIIPFAGTGGNGIHFGFLTDFKDSINLDNAPIVCISPSNDPPIKLVAKNLSDFLRLVVVIGEAEFLDDDYENEEDVELRLEEWDLVSEKDWEGNPLSNKEIEESRLQIHNIQKQRTRLIQVLKEDFKIEPMPIVYQYIKELRANRSEGIDIKTSDNIGIIYQGDSSKVQFYDYAVKDIDLINEFLQKANKPSRLQFYRDATFHFIISNDYDIEIKRLLIKYLKIDGYEREARILETKYN